MTAFVDFRRVGPMRREDAEMIRDLQKQHHWGYWPRIMEIRNQWFVIMFGARDAAEARQYVKGKIF